MSWPQAKLEALAADIPYAFVGGPFGSKLTTRDYVESGVPVIRGSNMNGGRYLDTTDFVFVSETKMRKDLSSNVARENDLIFTQRGTLGQVVMIPKTGLFPLYVVSQSQMKLTVDESKADRLFIYYYFSSSTAFGRITNLASSSGVPHINLTVLRNFELPVPPLETQRHIADILSAYDDLIENNRRRIALLEQAARELYREWFVRLRFPGHENTRIIDGVPEAWERVALENIGKLRYGRALKAEDRIDGDYPVYGSSGVVGTHDTPNVMGPGIIVGRKGNVGSVYWSDNDFCAIDTVYYLEPAAVTLYLYYTLANMDFINTDVAVPGLNRNLAHSRKFLLPSVGVQETFNEVAEIEHKQIALLRKENNSLEYARDLLLPRLMSGEVTV